MPNGAARLDAFAQLIGDGQWRQDFKCQGQLFGERAKSVALTASEEGGIDDHRATSAQQQANQGVQTRLGLLLCGGTVSARRLRSTSERGRSVDAFGSFCSRSFVALRVL